MNGKIAPVEGKVSEEMSDEEKAEAKTHRRIGLSYVTTKYLDVTGDGEDEALVIFGMTIGIPDPGIGTDVKPRLPQNVILHRERYSPPDPALLAAYDQRIRDFQAEQKMRVTDWTEQSALRVRDEAALTGREVLRGFLRDRGFSLR